MRFEDMQGRAKSNPELAKMLLGIIIDYLRQREQLPKEFADYLADCLENAVANPVGAQSALNLKKSSSKRHEDELRASAIHAVFMDYLKDNPSMSLTAIAKNVQEELRLHITPRQIVNLYKSWNSKIPSRK